MKISILVSFLGVLSIISTGATGQTIDPDAARVSLLKDCDGADDCFEDDVAALNTWIWNTRVPSAAAPLMVDIGPGRFTGNIACPQAAGYTTFRGSGRDATTLEGVDSSPGGGFPAIAVSAFECEDLAFQDLRIEASIAIYWIQGGSSSWTDVDVAAPTSWYEICGFPDVNNPGGPPIGSHYWWGAKVEGKYLTDCGQTWFYGSELLAVDQAALVIEGRADVRLFGTAVRVSATSGFSGATLIGVYVGNGAPTLSPAGYGEFHSHGGIINVNASAASGVNATALQVEDLDVGDAFAHTLGTAFVVKAGDNGTPSRVAGDGRILSPLLWQSGIDPPVAGLASLDGKDVFVETDCSSDGDCEGGGNEAHTMVYNDERCPTEIWFDSVTGRCRNDTTDPVADALDALDSRVTALENP